MKNLVFGCTVIVGLLVCGLAMAGTPCAGTSTVVATPACGAYCPRGDMNTITVTVTVRDCYGTPLEGIPVEITYAEGTTNRCWCPGTTTVIDTTDANGVATGQFRKFGGCGPTGCGISFAATAAGVLLGPSDPVVAGSPDNNRDCQVTVTDFTLFAGMYYTAACCSDLNCSGGLVDVVDFTIFAGHYYHACQ